MRCRQLFSTFLSVAKNNHRYYLRTVSSDCTSAALGEIIIVIVFESDGRVSSALSCINSFVNRPQEVLWINMNR